MLADIEAEVRRVGSQHARLLEVNEALEARRLDIKGLCEARSGELEAKEERLEVS